MGGHEHAHGPPYTVPHYSQFATKDIPELQELEKALAAKGLKDPWIRNEAWRYHPGFGTRLTRARKFFFRGFSVGLGLTIVTVAFDKLLGSGGHEHGHEGEEH